MDVTDRLRHLPVWHIAIVKGASWEGGAMRRALSYLVAFLGKDLCQVGARLLRVGALRSQVHRTVRNLLLQIYQESSACP